MRPRGQKAGLRPPPVLAFAQHGVEDRGPAEVRGDLDPRHGDEPHARVFQSWDLLRQDLPELLRDPFRPRSSAQASPSPQSSGPCSESLAAITSTAANVSMCRSTSCITFLRWYPSPATADTASVARCH